MKISDIQVYPVSRGPGRGNLCFVVVDTDEGVYGVGEVGLTGRELAIVGAVEHLKPVLLGQDPFRTEHLWQVMYRGGFFPAKHLMASAISGVDIALWDIKGKALGVPVYTLLGGLARDKVVCYPHTGAGDSRDPQSLVEACLRAKEESWKFVRFSVGYADNVLEPRRAVLDTIRRFRAVREAVGDEMEIVFDVHTRLDLPDALWLCEEVKPFRPFFMEDPLRSEDPESYRMLRLRTTVPLAAGEQFSSKWEFRALIENEWIDYARTDLCIVGGLTEAKKIAGWCETHHIKMAVHNPLGPVSTAACLHFNLSCPNVGVQEQPAKPGMVLTDVVLNQPEWADGYLLPPQRPGLGIAFDREAAKRHPAQMSERTHLRRADGSFTNW